MFSIFAASAGPESFYYTLLERRVALHTFNARLGAARGLQLLAVVPGARICATANLRLIGGVAAHQ